MIHQDEQATGSTAIASGRSTLVQRPSAVLSQVRIAAPCSASWDGMKGDERVRFCGECSRNVFNLSGMSRQEAEDLISGAEGRLCVRYYERKDGTVLTQDCPVGVRAVRLRIVRLLLWSAALLMAVWTGMLRKSSGATGETGSTGPDSTVQDKSFWQQIKMIPVLPITRPEGQAMMGGVTRVPPPDRQFMGRIAVRPAPPVEAPAATHR